MKVFIMRHGEAEVVASSDETRRLTDYGRKQSISQGQWLKTHLNLTALSVQKVIVSPYVRAQETFELVNSALDNILNDVETWSGITPYGNATLVADYLSVLQEPPFTDQGSIVDIFTDMSVWMGIKSVIDKINANAVA